MRDSIYTIPISEVFEPKCGCPICRMRDMYAHHYHRTDPHQLWATATMDLPALKAFCDHLQMK